MARLTYLDFGTHGTYMYAGDSYTYKREAEKAIIIVRPDSVSDDDALTIEVGEDFSQKLEKVLEEYKVKKWDGFSKSDSRVLDGSSFGFSASFDDGSRINAHGYMMYPKNYSQVSGALDGLFMTEYEKIRPNRKKVMTSYFEQVILKDCPRLENQEVGFSYISDGGNMFKLGKCECKGGAAMCPVYAFENDPEYMLVTYLRENDESPNAWVLSCEAYKITEKGEVLPWGEAVIDPHFFSSDRLYGHVFTHLYKDQLQLGCFTQKGFSASGRDTIYYIDLYDIGNKLEPLANEKVEGPSMNKEWWTPDKVANFTEVAEKFGFLQSRQHWEKVPNDPVFASGMNDSCNHRFDFLLTNNHGKGFYNALLATQKGDAVEGFRVHGKLYFR